MTTGLTLAARLDLGSVAALAAEFSELTGADLTVDAGQVDHLGALSAQLLVAAQRQWAAEGYQLTFSPRSAAFDDGLAVLGLTNEFTVESTE